ncbi:MAG: nitroreductase family protein [Dehalococcoidia bacterium]
MQNLKVARNRCAGNINSKNLSSSFLLVLVSLMMLSGSILIQSCSPMPANPQTPSAVTQSENKTAIPLATNPKTTLIEALKNRKSTPSFQTTALPKDVLVELLWAAWGINRPDGRRTAPSAMNAQDVDIYALLSDGTYIYDAKENQIRSVLAQDIRSKIGNKEPLMDAPVQLVYVADYAKFRTGTPSDKALLSACDVGFIGQNVYLYCAAQGLGAHFYASIDHDALKEALQLRADQAAVFAQAVGYPK